MGFNSGFKGLSTGDDGQSPC